MTPGEAAVMKASVGCGAVHGRAEVGDVLLAPRSRSFQSMGPSQAGRMIGRAPLGARGRSRESPPSRPAVAAGLRRRSR